MKLNKLLLQSAFIGLATTLGLHADTIRVQSDVTEDTTWTSGNTYILDTVIYVRNNATLEIEPGTVVKGATTVSVFRDGIDNAVSALWITRGSRLIADGTRNRPIIFTFEEDDITDNSDVAFDTSGMWGGVILCGNGVLNSAKSSVGGAATPIFDRYEGTTADGPNGEHLFGGDNDADSSGILRYVSIRYAGNVLANESELNSLTLAAVGSGTVISYVEAFNGSDDGFEFWGGVVNTDHLVSAFVEDDDFDTDQGYRGTNQFWFGIKPTWQGSSDSRGIESDGDLNQNLTGELPVSQWSAYNVTLIGRGRMETAFGGGSAWNARDEAAPNIYNAVVTDFNKGLKLDGDGLEYFQSQPALAEVRNSIFNVENTLDGTNGDYLFTDSAYANSTEDPLIGGVSYTQDLGLDPRPQTGSPALSGALAAPAGLVQTSYRGAFAPGDNWADGWTAVSQLRYLSIGVTVEPAEIVFARSGSALELNVATEIGRTYQLQSTASLAAPIAWADEGAPVVGTGASESFDQTIGASGDKYFRVSVE